MRQRGDPRWISAKYDGRCKCGREIEKGDRVNWFPAEKAVECSTCGAKTQAALDDERTNEFTRAM